jgi:hypothetical protein
VRRWLLAAAILLHGCASYNANYKANKFADEARKLDREGRTLEAGGYWARASVKADSILAHHPNGKYAPAAMAIKGEASAAVGQCGAASRLLPAAIEQLKDDTDREQATLALASCELILGTPELAANTVRPVTESRDGGRRRQALLLLGTAQRRAGQDTAALQSLSGLPGTPALIQRTLAYAGAREPVAATSAFDSLVALRDSMLPWDSVLAITGRADPELAFQFTSTLVRSRTLSPERSTALAFADATRLASTDTALQRKRYEDIIVVAGAGEAADRARFDMLRMQIHAADSMPDLTSTLEGMEAIAASNAALAGTLLPLRLRVQHMQRLMDSTSPGEPMGDMRLFLAAEFARDSLLAPHLAEATFASIPRGWPESPYAAKAWLAGRQLSGDTLDAGGQFSGSPYMAVLRGEEGATYTRLEDSLATFAQTLVAASAPKVAPGGPARRADGTINPNDEDAPTVRRRPQRPRSSAPGRTSTAPPVPKE